VCLCRNAPWIFINIDLVKKARSLNIMYIWWNAIMILSIASVIDIKCTWKLSYHIRFFDSWCGMFCINTFDVFLTRSDVKLKIWLWILHCVLADWSQLTFVKKQIVWIHLKILHLWTEAWAGNTNGSSRCPNSLQAQKARSRGRSKRAWGGRGGPDGPFILSKIAISDRIKRNN